MRKSNFEPIIGAKYGHLTVLEKVIYSEQNPCDAFRCLCDCGHETIVLKWFLTKSSHICCKHCSHARQAERKRVKNVQKYVGTKFNGWEIVRATDVKHPGMLYECRCLLCGNMSVRSLAQIKARKTERCENCVPDYHFEIVGENAVGKLRSGDHFLIDSEDVDRVNEYYWSLDKNGYIVSKTKEGGVIRLHRFLLNATDPKTFVDHINRKRLDCRKANLRQVSAKCNAYNHSKFSTNTSGYIGVYYSTWQKTYEVKIGYKGKRIRLGRSKTDLVRLAQMYNVAAKFFFGEYAGELNQVPEPQESLVRHVKEKCEKYLIPCDELHNVRRTDMDAPFQLTDGSNALDLKSNDR